jgi:hypothetical protein
VSDLFVVAWARRSSVTLDGCRCDMPIDIFWQDENGQILEKAPTWFNPWGYMDEPQDLDSTKCLRFIDEYGDTAFNQYQISILIEELESLRQRSKNEQARESLELLISFVRKAEGQVHTYIKFVGD